MCRWNMRLKTDRYQLEEECDEKILKAANVTTDYSIKMVISLLLIDKRSFACLTTVTVYETSIFTHMLLHDTFNTLTQTQRNKYPFTCKCMTLILKCTFANLFPTSLILQ